MADPSVRGGPVLSERELAFGESSERTGTPNTQSTYRRWWGRIGLLRLMFGVMFAVVAAWIAAKAAEPSRNGLPDGGRLQVPQAVAVAPDGTIYAADTGNGRVLGLDPRTGAVQVTLKLPFPESMRPRGIAVAMDGRVLVTDSNAHQVVVFAPSGAAPDRWRIPGRGTPPVGSTEGLRNITLDAKGRAYVADIRNHVIHRLAPDGRAEAKWGGEGSGPGQFERPTMVAISPDGSLFVTDTGNSRVQVFAPDGTYLRHFGHPGSGPGALDHPNGIAIDTGGHVYVADTFHRRIAVFELDGTFERDWLVNSSWLGLGSPGEPQGLTLDGIGDLVVANYSGHQVEVFTPNGRLLHTFEGRIPVPVVNRTPDPDGVFWTAAEVTGLGLAALLVTLLGRALRWPIRGMEGSNRRLLLAWWLVTCASLGPYLAHGLHGSDFGLPFTALPFAVLGLAQVPVLRAVVGPGKRALWWVPATVIALGAAGMVLILRTIAAVLTGPRDQLLEVATFVPIAAAAAGLAGRVQGRVLHPGPARTAFQRAVLVAGLLFSVVLAYLPRPLMVSVTQVNGMPWYVVASPFGAALDLLTLLGLLAGLGYGVLTGAVLWRTGLRDARQPAMVAI